MQIKKDSNKAIKTEYNEKIKNIETIIIKLYK